MSKERELLKKVISGDNKGDFFISYDLHKEIYEFLVHHEQPEQEPVTDKPTETAMAVMPNGVCVSNVYDAYEEGRKSVMSEQEPVAWMYDHQLEVGYDKYTEVNIIETCARNLESNNCINIRPLYLAPPKQEPLSDEEIVKLWANKSPANEFECVRLVEKEHGIGGGNE